MSYHVIRFVMITVIYVKRRKILDMFVSQNNNDYQITRNTTSASMPSRNHMIVAVKSDIIKSIKYYC